MKFVLLLMIFVVSTACKKEQSFDFPSGKFEMLDRTINFYTFPIYTYSAKNGKLYFDANFSYSDVAFEFDGKNKITYYSNIGSETFTVIKSETIIKENNSKHYSLQLKNEHTYTSSDLFL